MCLLICLLPILQYAPLRTNFPLNLLIFGAPVVFHIVCYKVSMSAGLGEWQAKLTGAQRDGEVIRRSTRFFYLTYGPEAVAAWLLMDKTAHNYFPPLYVGALVGTMGYAMWRVHVLDFKWLVNSKSVE